MNFCFARSLTTPLLVTLIALALVTHCCFAQGQIRLERDGSGKVVSASCTGASNLDRLKLTQRTLDSLAQLNELRSVVLWGTEVTNEDIKKLLPLKQLVSIDLSYTRVTGEVLATLADMPELVMVNLEGCDVDDRHLANLKPMVRLHTLRLAKCGITDDGLKYLRGMKELVHLDLSTCEITDEGLKSIGQLPSIQHLWLSKTVRYGKDDKSKLTDGCVDYLASLKSLVDLQIADSRLTEVGLKRLRESLPNTRISTESSGVLYIDINKPND